MRQRCGPVGTGSTPGSASANSLNEPMRDRLLTRGLSERNPIFAMSSSCATTRPIPRLRARPIELLGRELLEWTTEQAPAIELLGQPR